MTHTNHAPSSAPYSWAPPGTLVAGRYRLERLLSAGGMGVVYSGADLDTGRRVAVKILRREYVHNVAAKRRFLREARLLGAFRGSGVPRVLDVGEYAESQLYMVLELLHGPDLRRVVGARDISIHEAADIVVEVCHALLEAHDGGVVHRDIKPENIVFVDSEGRGAVKLIDFGIAKEGGFPNQSHPPVLDEAAVSAAGRALGSPRYMAPEQQTNPEQVDTRADIWSLGVLLFELLTGQPPVKPWEGLNLVQLGELPDGYAQVFGGIIARCLRVNRQERFADLRQLLAALAPFTSEPLRERLGLSHVAVRSGLVPSHRIPRHPSQSGVFPALKSGQQHADVAGRVARTCVTVADADRVHTLDVSSPARAS